MAQISMLQKLIAVMAMALDITADEASKVRRTFITCELPECTVRAKAHAVRFHLADGRTLDGCPYCQKLQRVPLQLEETPPAAPEVPFVACRICGQHPVRLTKKGQPDKRGVCEACSKPH